MSEKALAERMQILLDKNETYIELCGKVDEAKARVDALTNQYSEYEKQIEDNSDSLAKLNARIHEAEPDELAGLKVKIDKFAGQILADKNWLLKLSNNQKRGVVDAARRALMELQEKRTKLFFDIVTGLRDFQTRKVEDCLKMAVGHQRFWSEALRKVEQANHITKGGELFNDAKILPVSFINNYPHYKEEFDFNVLVRRYE